MCIQLIHNNNICISLSIYIYIYTCIYISIYIYICINMLLLCISVSVCVCVCIMFLCVHVTAIRVCTCIYKHTKHMYLQAYLLEPSFGGLCTPLAPLYSFSRAASAHELPGMNPPSRPRVGLCVCLFVCLCVSSSCRLTRPQRQTHCRRLFQFIFYY